MGNPRRHCQNNIHFFFFNLIEMQVLIVTKLVRQNKVILMNIKYKKVQLLFHMKINVSMTIPNTELMIISKTEHHQHFVFLTGTIFIKATVKIFLKVIFDEAFTFNHQLTF